MEEEIERIMPYLNSSIINERIDELRYAELQRGERTIVDYMQPLQMEMNIRQANLDRFEIQRIAYIQARYRLEELIRNESGFGEERLGNSQYPFIENLFIDNEEDDDIYIK